MNVMSTAGASILGIGYLLPLVYLMWSMRYGPKASGQPWRRRARVADDVAAADRELRDAAGRDRGGVRLSPTEPTAACVSDRSPEPLHRTSSTTSPSSARPRARHVDVPRHRDPLFRRAARRLHVYRNLYPDGIPGRQPPAEHHARDGQHGGADPLAADDGARRPRRPRRGAQTARPSSARRCCSASCSSASRRSSRSTKIASTTCPARTSRSAGRTRSIRAALLLVLLRDDRDARAPHGHRPRLITWLHRDGAPGPLRARVPRAGRHRRALLALRGHRLDLPLPAPLSDRSAAMKAKPVSRKIARFSVVASERSAAPDPWRRRGSERGNRMGSRP